MAISLRNVNCYSYSSESETRGTSLGNDQAIDPGSSSQVQIDGYLDLVDLAYMLSSKSSRTDYKGGSEEHEAKTILFGNFLYTYDSGEWMKHVVTDPAGAIEERDELQSMTDMVKGSSFEVIGREQINGENCFKVRFAPDTRDVQPILAQVDHDSISSGEAVWTAWISADDYILRRVAVEIMLPSMPQSVHPSEELRDLKAEPALKKTTNFSGFNEKKPIVLPREAVRAKIAAS